MSDVQRWNPFPSEPDGIDVVAASDYDALRARVSRADKLFRLAAEDVIFFSTYCEASETWKDSPYYAPCVRLNDTFGYATADGDELPDDQIAALIECHKRWEHDGVTAWAAHRRNAEPLPQLRTEKYHAARAWLKEGGK